MVILNKIDELMLKKNLNDPDLAELTGLPRMTIGNARRGKGITLRTALLISEALNVAIGDLFYFSEEETAA
jgi:DNA-binding Xre family transcriptional regulator